MGGQAAGGQLADRRTNKRALQSDTVMNTLKKVVMRMRMGIIRQAGCCGHHSLHGYLVLHWL